MKIQFYIFLLFFNLFTANSQSLTLSIEVETDSPLFKKAQLLVDSIAEEMETDVKIELKTMGAKRSERELTKGNTDGNLGRALEAYQNNDQVVRVNIPFLTQNIVCFSNKDIVINGPESIRNLRILHIRDATVIEKYLKKHSLSSVGISNASMAFRMLRGDRADIFIGTSFRSNLLLTPDLKNSGIKLLNPPLMTFPVYIFLHKKHQDLVPDFEQAIKRLIDSGRVKEIFGDN